MKKEKTTKPDESNVSSNIRCLLRNEERSLFEERARLRDAGWLFKDRLRLLIDLHKELGLKEPDKLSIMHDDYDESLTTKIDKLTLEGHKHPFFSESTLYELVGKEQARSVLALIEKIKQELDT